MTFLYPNFLWLLSLATLPMILHLLSRIRLKRVNFSALYFLKDIKRERFSWFRLKEILLLIFRTLLIVFLFLALARPKIQGRILPLKRQAHSVIIIDDSYSMGYGNEFEQAKLAAKVILNQLSSESKVTILTSSGIYGFYRGQNLKLAESFIDSLVVSYFSSDLSKSLIAAQTDLAQSSFANQEIFIISDLQKKAFLPVLQNLKPRFPVYVIDVGQKVENSAVTSVFLSERFPQPDHPAKIGAKIKNYRKDEVIQKVVLKLLDKTEVKQIKIAGNEEKTVLFESEVSAPGKYYGSVQIESDSLKVDDFRYFAFSVLPKMPVLLVYSQASDIFYLEKALAPESSNTFQVITTDEKDFLKKNLSGFDVIGVINPTNFSRAHWQRINYYVQNGGKVFIALGSEPKDKTGLEQLCDYEIGFTQAGFVSIERIQTDHPIFEIFAGIDLSSAKFFQWSKIKPKQAKTLASFSDGNPFLLASADGNYIIAASNFDLAATDLVLKPVFLPLIQRIFFYLAQGNFKTEYQVGDTTTLEVSTPGLIKLKTPKEEYSVMPEIINNKRILKIEKFTEPGIYQIDDNVLAVNIDVKESDLNRVSENDLVRAGFKIRKEDATRAIDLSGLALFFAFLALAMEMILLLI